MKRSGGRCRALVRGWGAYGRAQMRLPKGLKPALVPLLPAAGGDGNPPEE